MLNPQGHEEQKELLRTLNAHTLLFTGPEGVGKRQIARWYAKWLNCEQLKVEPSETACEHCASCLQFATETANDYREISPQTLTSTGRLSRRPEIRIGQLVPRDDSEDLPLSRWLETRPSFCKRVGVIDGAQLLNVSAANAFLKTLEEPPSHALIILIAPSAQAVLPTIASRATIIRFGTLTLANNAHPLARLGRPGDYYQAQNDAEHFQDLQNLLERYVQSLNKGLEAAFESADALEKTWSAELNFDLHELLLAKLSESAPQYYPAFSKALDDFELAVAAYSSATLAMQVLTLELRSICGYG